MTRIEKLGCIFDMSRVSEWSMLAKAKARYVSD